MNLKHKKGGGAKLARRAGGMVYRDPFPRPICLEKCTVNIPNGYEKDILKTLKAFSDKDAYGRKKPHKLEGKYDLHSIDVKSRHDKYRMLYYFDDGICKITNLCTEETHKG